MLPQRHSPLIFGLLLGVWVLVMAWQVEEHVRVRNAARVALVNRAKDISTTLGIVLRSQRRFGGVVSKERLEASLAELAKQESAELRGIALLNAAGEMVASAGTGTDFQIKGATDATGRWDSQTVTLVNPMDLGTNLTYDFEGTNPPIIMSRGILPIVWPPITSACRHRGHPMNRRPNPRLERARRTSRTLVEPWCRHLPGPARMANLPATGASVFVSAALPG